MDVFLKRYFWVINLGVVALCGVFAGRAASHVVAGAYLTEESSRGGSGFRRSGPGPVQKTRTKDSDEIVKRNVFCSGCTPPEPVASTSGDTNPNAAPQKTSLQLELVSTMVCPSDDEWSVAVIKDTSTKEKDSAWYNHGKKIGSTNATVDTVQTKRVYILNGGRKEYLELEGATAEKPAATVASLAPPSSSGGIDPAMGDIDKGVNCNGNNCTVDRALVEKMLQNTTMLATAARFVPSIKDGKPNGFKLYAIRPNSIFGKIGLQNGDTIKQINGNEMTTPDQALQVYTKLRNASHLAVQVERHGETVALDYAIR